MKTLVVSLFVLMLTIGPASAQTFRGAINGTVTDPSGAVVPNAQIKATEVATGRDHTTVSTNDGQFAFQDIPLGLYKVTVTAQGFSVYTVDKVQVLAGQIYTLPIKLSVTQAAESVEVSAASVTVDTTTQTQTYTIPSQVVQDVPLNGRDYTQLIAVNPGYGGYSVGGFGSLNGTRPNQVNWQIDGVDNNDFWHNIPAVNQGGVSGIAGVVLPIDTIDEFSSQTQSGAEAGRNAGGTVNLVLKSGGNTIHGSAYVYVRNEAYSASSPFFTPSATQPNSPELRNINYGFSVGGPIIKKKTFYFLGFEKQQYIIGLSGLATEPSDAWVNKALGVLAAHGVAESSLSAKLIGSNGFWPRNLIGSLPATVDNFFSPVTSTGYSYNGVIKLDHNFTENEHLSVRWFGGQGSQTAPLGGSPALGTASSNLKDYFEVAPLHVYNYSAILNSEISPRLTNQVLFGVNYFNQIFHDFNNSFDTKALGLFLSPDATDNGKPISGAPNVVIAPPASTNAPGFEQIGLTPPEGRNDVTGHLTDIVSYTLGKQQLRFGAEVRQARVDEFYHRRGTGQFVFDGTAGPWASDPAVDPTTRALADFLAGDVSACTPDKNTCGSSIAVGDPERFVTVNAFNFFFQDAWQLSDRLNVNLGLRYDYFGPMHSDRKDLAVFIPGQGLRVQGAGIDSIFPPDKNNFAPRIGFSYQPTQRGDVVVRAGFGVFYDQINLNPFLDFRPPITAAQGIQGNPFGSASVSTFSAPFCNNTDANSYNWESVQQSVCPARTDKAGQANPTGSIFSGVAPCLDPNCTGTSGLNLFTVSQDFRTPYFYNYNLQVEKGFGSKAVLQVGYVGSQGRKLNIVTNINEANNSGIRPFGNFGNILQLNSIGTSNYNALQTSFRVSAWHGLTSEFNYTWSHALDEISEYRAVIADNPNNIKADYGNGDYDTRHHFTTSLTYDIPGSSHGPQFLTHGWQVSSLWNFHTGQPYDVTLGGALGLHLIGDPFSGVSHSFSKDLASCGCAGVQWVNLAAYGPGPQNIGRNKFHGPGFGDVDLSVFKNIPVRERFTVQLRAEMFNLFNRINFASGPGSVNPNGTVTDTIGDFNGAPGIGPGEAFNMQLAAKIKF